MADSENNLSLVLNQQDSSGVNILNRSIGAISYDGSVGDFTKGKLTDTAEQQQTFPEGLSTALQFYFKNTHATAKVTVAWTPTGGAKSTIAIIGPGGVIALWGATSAGSVGFTALYYTSDTANATFEHFIGG
jgi:hypothetical protein